MRDSPIPKSIASPKPNLITRYSAIALAVFLALAAVISIHPAPFAFESALSNALASFRSPVSDRMMISVTQLGDSEVLIGISAALIVLLCALRRWREAAAYFVAFLGTTLLVSLIKIIIHRPRPLADLYLGAESFSFPSGHMTNSAVVIGSVGLFVAAALGGRPSFLVRLATIIIVFAVGLSRIYLGAHWLLDIVGGLCLATVVFTVLQGTLKRFSENSALVRPRPVSEKLAVYLGIAILLIATGHILTNTSLPNYAIG